MNSSLVISNFRTGYETDRKPFVIDNDAFPVLENAYIFRGRIHKKRGTSLLGRLQYTFTAASLGDFSSATTSYNLFMLLGVPVASAMLNTGFVITIGAPDSQTLTDTGTGTLTIAPTNPAKITSATINYTTGVLTLTWGGVVADSAATFTGGYFPCLPVMGIEDFFKFTSSSQVPTFPTTVFFDTIYAYQYNNATRSMYNVNFYKNTEDPLNWSAPDYQQFWSCNWQNALWVTNNKPGFFAITISNVTLTGNNTEGAVATITTSAPHGLSGATPPSLDYVFINEVSGIVAGTDTPKGEFGGLNGVSGIATYVSSTQFTIPAPWADGSYSGTPGPGIVQYMTQSNSGGQGDGIRWYDGDPTAGVAGTNNGFVNFSPPLSVYDDTKNPNPSYLCGAQNIVPFKNSLLFFGCWIATSADALAGTFSYFKNRMIASQDGTAFYAQPVPVEQTADPLAYSQGNAGRGFQIDAPYEDSVVSVEGNEDVLIIGFENHQAKLIASGNDSLPFYYQTINPEIGAQSTFSGVALDTGVVSIGNYGITLTTQESMRRLDVTIPDQVFNISVGNQGSQRVCAIRDYRNEFIYFTYAPVTPSALESSSKWIYPTQTLLYNYRDNNWAILNESYTHYGNFRQSTGLTWAILGDVYGTWSGWTDPWNFGRSGARFPQVAGGNQQGFVMLKDTGVREDNSQYISDIDISGNTVEITSPNHCLSETDFIEINNCIFTGSTSTPNGIIYQVGIIDANTFNILLNNGQPILNGTYIGNGIYRKITNISVKTKQFPIFWEGGRQARIGTQRFLLDTTTDGQLTVQMFCSQSNSLNSYDPAISPFLPFSNILLTTPPPNQLYKLNQSQIWQRMSNSFIGDTVQLGFTLSDTQMFDPLINTSEIALHAIAIELKPGPLLA